MTVVTWVGAVLAGGVGAVARFLLDGAVNQRVGGRFPAGTFVVNVTGSLLLGLVTGLALGHAAALVAGTAAVGSFTTFSTWMLETQRGAEERQVGIAALNVVVSLVVGIAAAALGQWIGVRA